MATTPRRKSNRTTSSTRAKKPTTIDLEAVEVKDSAESDTSEVSNEAVKHETAAEDAKPKAQPKTTPKQTRSTSHTAKKTQSSAASSAPKTASEPAVEANPSTSSHTPERVKKDPVNSGTGFGKLLAAGLIGSAITLGGAGYMQYEGYLPLITKYAGINNTPEVVSVPDLAPLQAEIAELRSKLENQPVPERPVIDLSPIETRLTNVEEGLVQSLNALAAAETALTDISTNSGSEGNLQLAQEMAKIKTDLNKLKSSSQQLAIKLAARPEGNLTSPLVSENINEIITPLLSPLTNADDKNQEDIDKLKRNISAISSRIDKALVSRIKQIELKLKNAATGEQLAKSVAVNALKSALESGKPYSAALASVETLTGASEALEQLRPEALTGITTTQTLIDEFRDMQSKILLAANNNGKAGLSDRVMFSIKSLVTISSDKPLSGNTPEAILSRIDAGLKSNNLKQALAEWQSLPEPAQSISKIWADKLQQRYHADQQLLELMKSIQSTSTSG